MDVHLPDGHETIKGEGGIVSMIKTAQTLPSGRGNWTGEYVHDVLFSLP
jgi:hypothetical protein